MVAPLTRRCYMLMGSSPSRPPDGNFGAARNPSINGPFIAGLAVCLG